MERRRRKRCRFPAGVTIKPDGVNSLAPCVYETKEIHRNVTVEVCQCKVCGHIELFWTPQEDSEHEIIAELQPVPEDE